MTQWATFVGLTGVVTVLLLALSRATESALIEPTERDAGSRADRAEGAGVATPPLEPAVEERGVDDGRAPVVGHEEEPNPGDTLADSMSTGTLLANVALSQGLFAALLVGAALYAAIPPEALGLDLSRAYVTEGVLYGTVAGMVLYAANEAGAAGARRAGIDHDEGLRELLAPDSAGGWLVLLVGVLPLIAIFEELLFRAALIGAVSAGYGLSPWPLAIGSSIAFALGHGIQGTAGIVVTGLLGFALAALFIATGSLLAVVVAHYLVNALEFVVHEGIGLEPGGAETA
ncbi:MULTISPECIES: CPBP family intramembrane glutamic endopeptidase [Saliphagus]|uniref:CPBP family intramembrane glutamic endopeptidase n=1 Tax=Saliphagus infecundisoli TaxID=1849069 RepID=A0ABD5QF08_9EURY|nr:MULTISPECIES: CPBP family intramembrane glutamic endopeptidase [Saliphagus]